MAYLPVEGILSSEAGYVLAEPGRRAELSPSLNSRLWSEMDRSHFSNTCTGDFYRQGAEGKKAQKMTDRHRERS